MGVQSEANMKVRTIMRIVENVYDGGKLPPICFDGPLGLDFFEEATFNFPIQSKRDFNKEVRLRSYDNSKEDWPKCMHGENCLVQMFVKGG
jgi:hypothetical protein